MSHRNTPNVVDPEETANLSRGKSGFISYLFGPHSGETENSSEKRNTSGTAHGQRDSLKTFKSLSPPGLFSG